MFRRLKRRLRILRFRLGVLSARKALPRAFVRNLAIFYLLIMVIAAGIVAFTLYPATFQRLGVAFVINVQRIARDGAHLVPTIASVRPGLPGRDVLQEAIPYLETGPEPLSRGNIITTVRRMVEFVTGYDFSDPRSFFVAEAGGVRLGGSAYSRVLQSVVLSPREGKPEVEITLPSVEPNVISGGQQGNSQLPAAADQLQKAVEAGKTHSARPEGQRTGPEPPAPESRVPEVPPKAELKVRSWGDKPVVLIFHHHAGEDYSNPGDPYAWNRYKPGQGPDSGVVEVGARLAKRLQEDFGVPVLHHKEVFDYPYRSRAYLDAEKPMQELIKQNPQLRMVLDIHRDEGSAVTVLRTQPVSTAGVSPGEEVAEVVLVVGAGGGRDLPHPNWRQNYEFALLFASKMKELFPELSPRGVILAPERRYNQHLHPHAVILEVGAHENTREAALRAADLLAEVVVAALEELQ